MPYSRGYKRRYKKRRYAKKGKSLWQTGMGYYSKASWLAKQVWKLKGLVNSEMHKLDVNNAGGTVTTAAYAAHLSAVAVGDTFDARTGNSIYARSLNIKGQVVYNGTAGATPTFLRLLVVQDTQQIGDTSPAISDVLSTASSGYNAHINAATAGRFKLLYSDIHATDSVQNTVKKFDINLPMRHHIRYNGTASTDIQKGGLYIMAISDQATNGPKLIFDSRLSFHDN